MLYIESDLRETFEMRIREDYRKITTFLLGDYVDDSGVSRKQPVATAFFINFVSDIENQEDGIVYAVTARHNITRIRATGSSTISIRINTDDGKFRDYEINLDKWIEDDLTDIAMVEMIHEADWDIRAFPHLWLANDDFIAKNDVGIGDDVFFIGFFQGHPGQQRVLPIVRYGAISMMADEPVTLEVDAEQKIKVDAFLVESHSWGGHSGSPVFIYFSAIRHPNYITLKKIPSEEPDLHLLGLVSAHFNIRQRVEHRGDVLGEAQVNLNSGIAVVIPAQKITDLLMREDVIRRRENIKAAS